MLPGIKLFHSIQSQTLQEKCDSLTQQLQELASDKEALVDSLRRSEAHTQVMTTETEELSPAEQRLGQAEQERAEALEQRNLAITTSIQTQDKVNSEVIVAKDQYLHALGKYDHLQVDISPISNLLQHANEKVEQKAAKLNNIQDNLVTSDSSDVDYVHNNLQVCLCQYYFQLILILLRSSLIMHDSKLTSVQNSMDIIDQTMTNPDYIASKFESIARLFLHDILLPINYR